MHRAWQGLNPRRPLERAGVCPPSTAEPEAYTYKSEKKIYNTELPSHVFFINKIKNQMMTDEEYSICPHAWRDNTAKPSADFLVWYYNLDTWPFIKAVEKMHFFIRNIQRWRFITWTSIKLLMKSPNGEIYILDEKHK